MIEDWCVICGYDNEYTLQKHHIVPRRFGGSDDEDNLVSLCANCHEVIEKIYDKSFYNALGVTSPDEDDQYTTVVRTERSALVPRGAVDLKTDPGEPLSVSTALLKEHRELAHCMNTLSTYEFSKLHHRDKFELLLSQHEEEVDRALTHVFRDKYPEKVNDGPPTSAEDDANKGDSEDSPSDNVEDDEDSGSDSGQEKSITERLDEMGL